MAKGSEPMDALQARLGQAITFCSRRSSTTCSIAILLMRVEVRPTAEKLFTMLPGELARVLFPKSCNRVVCASILINESSSAHYYQWAKPLGFVFLPGAARSLHWE